MPTVTSLCVACLLFLAVVDGRTIFGTEQKLRDYVGGLSRDTEKGIRDIGRLIPGRENNLIDAVAGLFTGSYQGIREVFNVLDQKFPNKGFKLPDGPINPSKVLVLLLRAYCQLLMEQGAVNLPDYCYGYLIIPRGGNIGSRVPSLIYSHGGSAEAHGQAIA